MKNVNVRRSFRLITLLVVTTCAVMTTSAAFASVGDILIIYADTGGAPTQLQTALLAQPGVTSVVLFDGNAATPTLAQLTPYETVVPFSNDVFSNDAALGDVLADYVDAGGVVVQFGFAHYGPSQAYGINGRWLTGNYNPYTYSTALVLAVPFTLGAFNAADPMMAGVTALASNFQNVVTLAPGAVQAAAASNGNSLAAHRLVGVRTTYAVTAYIGSAAAWSGDFARVIVNAVATTPVLLQDFHVE
jgi:hypothetical protein